MTPDFERSLNERLEQASLKELMPGFDKETEWLQLSHKLDESNKRRISPVWRYAAAILILFIVGGGIAYLQVSRNFSSANLQVVNNSITPAINWGNMAFPAYAGGYKNNTEARVADVVKKDAGKHSKTKTGYIAKTGIIKQDRNTARLSYKSYAKGYVCNSTPYPIQICILQTIKCAYDKPMSVASCSTLEPDQSGRLHYKAPGKIAENCKVTVQEIRITRPTTGETIVLTANSKPATAQDVFNCITGKSKRDILAGAFYSDCDESEKRILRIDNNFGNLILQ